MANVKDIWQEPALSGIELTGKETGGYTDGRYILNVQFTKPEVDPPRGRIVLPISNDGGKTTEYGSIEMLDDGKNTPVYENEALLEKHLTNDAVFQMLMAAGTVRDAVKHGVEVGVAQAKGGQEKPVLGSHTEAAQASTARGKESGQAL